MSKPPLDLNILGSSVLPQLSAATHLYGKSDQRKGRRGHLQTEANGDHLRELIHVLYLVAMPWMVTPPSKEREDM